MFAGSPLAFGAACAPLRLLPAMDVAELRRTVERESQEECPCNPEDADLEEEEEDEDEADEGGDIIMEHGAVIRIPLVGMAAVEALGPEGQRSLKGDLSTFEDKTGVRVELHSPVEGSPLLSAVLSGIPEEVRAAREEIDALLHFYGLLRPQPANAPAAGAEDGGDGPCKEPAETIEVDGMTLQSMPKRNRRVKRGQARDEGAAAILANAPVAASAAAGDLSAGPCRGCDMDMDLETEVRQYEYMDHTADVILHSWGSSLREAMEQCCVCFFSYMTELDTVDVTTTVEVEASGHDILDLLYHLLDEFLFSFGTEFVVCRRVRLLELDEERFTAKAQGFGERFDLKKHPQGTEIKAITMHQIKVLTPSTLTTEEGAQPRKDSSMEGGVAKEGFPFECYVLVDI